MNDLIALAHQQFPQASVNAQSALGSFPEWDSLGHFNLLLLVNLQEHPGFIQKAAFGAQIHILHRNRFQRRQLRHFGVAKYFQLAEKLFVKWILLVQLSRLWLIQFCQCRDITKIFNHLQHHRGWRLIQFLHLSISGIRH